MLHYQHAEGPILNGLKYVLEEEWRYRHGNELPDRFSWQLIPCLVSQTPSQKNNFDCGVFVCMITDLLSQGYTIHELQQSDLLYSREKIAASLLANKIIR